MQGYFKEEMISVEKIWHTSFVVSKDISPKITFISATKTQKKENLILSKIKFKILGSN